MTEAPDLDVDGLDEAEPTLAAKRADVPATVWRQYEMDVAELLANTDPDAVVTHDHQVVGKSGRSRQVDVMITGHMGGSKFRIAVECKRYASKLQITTVDAFAGKLADLGVDRGVLYTFSTPSAGALARAKSADHPKIEIRHVSRPALLRHWASFAHDFVGWGDCPNPNCYTGDITWRTWTTSNPPVEAGSCDICGTWAARCPTCEQVIGFFTDDADCFDCNNTFHLEQDRKGANVEDVIVEFGTA